MVRTPAPTLTSAVASASGWTISPAATSAAATSTGTRLEAERDHAANARPAPKTSSNPSAIQGMRRCCAGVERNPGVRPERARAEAVPSGATLRAGVAGSSTAVIAASPGLSPPGRCAGAGGS